MYSPFALIPTTPPSSLSIHWARSSSLMLMQRAHGLLIGSPAMPDDTDSTDIDDTNAAWRRFWQGRSWNFLILGLSFPFFPSHGDLNFCHRLGSTIFPFIVVPLRVARTSVTGRVVNRYGIGPRITWPMAVKEEF